MIVITSITKRLITRVANNVLSSSINAKKSSAEKPMTICTKDCFLLRSVIAYCRLFRPMSSVLLTPPCDFLCVNLRIISWTNFTKHRRSVFAQRGPYMNLTFRIFYYVCPGGDDALDISIDLPTYVSIYTYKRVVCVCLFVCLLFIGHTTFVHFAALPPSGRESRNRRRGRPRAGGRKHAQREHARMPYNFSTKKWLR